jgi:hypothetical protein
MVLDFGEVRLKKFLQNLAVLFFGFIFATQIFAQLDGNPPNICRNGYFPREGKDYQMARIIGKAGEKIYFYGDEREDCPQGKNCRLKSYLIPADEIIVSRTLGGYVCSWFQPRKGSETVGWINVDNLEWIETNQKPAANDWLGEWRFYDNSITISKSKTPDLFDVKGNAVWKGLGDNVHVGELDESGKPSANTLKLGEKDTEEYACKVSMQLVGKFLIVADNMNCGGANVTFSGVYRKK